MNVHDHITDWQHLPSSFLAGKRAIATTVEGTTIKYSNDLLDGSEAFVYGVIMQARLLDHIIDHCRSMLGYSGNMPSEVPNQSEDAKK